MTFIQTPFGYGFTGMAFATIGKGKALVAQSMLEKMTSRTFSPSSTSLGDDNLTMKGVEKK